MFGDYFRKMEAATKQIERNEFLKIWQESDHRELANYFQSFLSRFLHKEVIKAYQEFPIKDPLDKKQIVLTTYYGVALICDGQYINARECLVANVNRCKEIKFYSQEIFIRKQLGNICLSLEELDECLKHINIILDELDDHLEPIPLYDMLISKYYLQFQITKSRVHINELEQLKFESVSNKEFAIRAKKNYILGKCYMLTQQYKKAQESFKASLAVLDYGGSNLNNILMAKKCILAVIFNTSKPLDCINFYEGEIKDILPKDGYLHTKINVYYILHKCYSSLKKFELAFYYQGLYYDYLNKKKDQKIDFKLIKHSADELLSNPFPKKSEVMYIEEFSKTTKTSSFLEELIDLLVLHHNNIDLNVNFISSQMSMSRSKFFRQIATKTNSSFSNILNKIRIDASLELLKDHKLSLSEIAFRCGFNSSSYFSKCFKQMHAESPKVFRNQI